MKKILISDAVKNNCISLFKTAGFEVQYNTGLSKDELLKIIPAFNALIVRSSTQVDSDIIAAMKSMEVIGRAGTGVDNIDVNSATRKGIVVMNTPGGNTISTAEHTMALILSMCRNIPQSNLSLLNKKWERKNFSGTELYGKTLAIIGLGKIGREVAKRAEAFGMSIIGYDPLLSSEVAKDFGILLVELDKIWQTADIITVHVPLNDSTKDLINSQTFKKCKDGVKIINCARGGIINEEDLVIALDSGKVSSAAFDVYLTEPPDFSNRLINHPKVVCTPHLGASTDEAQEKVAIQIAEQIVQYFNEGKITGAVNLKGFFKPVEIEMQPFLNLGEKLGSFISQIFNEKLKHIVVTLSGKSLHNYESEIAASVLKGFLENRLSEPVNYVNSFSIIEEMGISLRQVRKGGSDRYKNLLTVELISESSVKKVSGTVFGSKELRIVEIDEFLLEIKPEGNMLLLKNIDKPGMIASIGRILADGDINIAGLSLGRIEKGKEALTVINIDSRADSSILNEISSTSGIINIYPVGINY
ncbi:MAG: phosphoglycerate dehydrogenase [Ignavibacterium sp.]|nr:phosphoglycerate dehydrogenase [Ignavibacterium sp.]